MKTILFLAPRLHTNQIPLLDALKKKYNIFFAVVGSDKLDTVKNKELVRLKPSFLQDFFFKSDLKDKNFSYYSTYFLINFLFFRKLFFSIKPDFVVVRNSSPLSAIFSIFLFSFFIKFKLIFYTQTPIYKNKISFKRRLIKYFVFKLFDSWYSPVLCKPFVDINFLERDERIEYIPFCMKKNKMNTNNDLNTVSFLSISKFEPRKNILNVIKCFNHLNKLGYNYQYNIVGQTGNLEREKYFDYLKNYVKVNRIVGINFFKNIDFSDMKNHYSCNNVYILNSSNETASISQLEAMSYGMPIIIGNDNGTASYVKDNGFIIDSFNDQQIIDKIIFFISNKDKIAKMGKRSYEICRQNHSPENILNKFENLL